MYRKIETKYQIKLTKPEIKSYIRRKSWKKKKRSLINNKESRLVFPLTFSDFTGQPHLLHPNVQVGIFGAISKLL